MLRYAGIGTRDFFSNPVLMNRRQAWEFHAAVSGEIYLQEPGGRSRLSKKTMWLFPPEHLHGWNGNRDELAEVVVFHFTRVPDLIRDYVGLKGSISIDLTDGQCGRLNDMGREVISKLKEPRALDSLYHDGIALELSTMMLNAVPVGQLPRTEESNLNRLESACTYFELHMESSPGMEDLAEVANCSPAHLRRLFHSIYHCSPKEKLTEIRFEHCTKLLSVTDFSLDRIAELCGYSCTSVLSRAFTKRFGQAPSRWRELNQNPTIQENLRERPER